MDVCRGCRSVVAVGPAFLCERCRIRVRHAARELRHLLWLLANDDVLSLLDELADRAQSASGWPLQPRPSAVESSDDGWCIVEEPLQ